MNQELSIKMFERVAKERLRQDVLWGEQSHEDGYWYAILGEEFGEIGKALCNNYYRFNNPTDQDLVKEKDLEEEIIQTAAVCIAWLEAVERRKTENDGSATPPRPEHAPSMP